MAKAGIGIVPQQTTGSRASLGLAAVFLTFLLASLIIYGLNIAMPAIAADLNGMALYSWAISLPALAAAFVTLLFGKLSDIYGRRSMLMICLVFFLAGAVLAAVSGTFVFNIAGRVVNALGYGAMAALCFSVIGDLYAPAERSRWTGLLQISAGIAATLGPILVGMITDNLSWRYFFWATVPLTIACGILVMIGVPPRTGHSTHRIDFAGSCVLAVASSSMILGISFADRHSWLSLLVMGLLAASLVFWCLFIRIELWAEEPILDPQVFTNRSFLTAAVAALLSFFGFIGILNYYPLFLQGVQGASATLSGQMLTPFSMLMAFMGVPAGLLLARTKRYKWMYIVGYAVPTAAIFCMATFSSETPVWMGMLVTALSGFGLGAIPTINTLVVQFAVPKRLLGVAVAAIFFVVAISTAITPAIMGSVMNSTYEEKLKDLLPAELSRLKEDATLESLADPRVLMSKEAVAKLRNTCNEFGDQGPEIFNRTVRGIRTALESSLKMLFLIAAMAMLAAFFFIVTIPEISMDVEVQDRIPVRQRSDATT